MATMQNFLSWIKVKSKRPPEPGEDGEESRSEVDPAPGPGNTAPGPVQAGPRPAHANPGPAHLSSGLAHPGQGPAHPDHGSANPVPGPAHPGPGPAHLHPGPAHSGPGPAHLHPGPAHPGPGPTLPGSPSRTASCRLSMKLPPIPRAAWTRQSLPATRGRPSVPVMGVARLRTDSPAHIYEEIPHQRLDASDVTSRGADHQVAPAALPISRLDFAQAKEFGSYLVVPIKDKHKRKHAPDVKYEAPVTVAPDDDPSSDSAYCTYPGDAGSSGDSAIADVSHDGGHHRQHVHCARCHRPHGVYNGVTLGHFDENTDPHNFDIQTYFNKAMLEEQVPPAVAFKIVDGSGDLKDGGVLSVDDGDRRFSESTPRGKETSCHSDDTGNEYDVRSSDMSSQSHSRPGSFAFDSASSLYALSGSERDMTSQLQLAPACQRHQQSQSQTDSSNDAFSEYDMQAGGDYEYFLSRVQHNLWLKKEVMRVIRESESSEYETVADVTSCVTSCGCSCLQADDSSLTGVSSLSDGPHSGKEDAASDVITSKAPSSGNKHERGKRREHSKSCVHGKMSKCKAKTRSKSRHRSERRDMEAEQSVCEPSQTVPAWERPAHRPSEARKVPGGRHKLTTAPPGRAEVYCLPDFPAPVDPESMERLSCRATSFKPQPAAKCMTSQSRVRSPHGTSVGQIGGPGRPLPQNRMLSDLMKMNHDRLLVLF